MPRKSSAVCNQSAPSLVTRHPSLVTRRHPAAFTLIELLVVIAIIAILAGLAFPAVQGALESGKKAQARNDVHQLAAAVKAFQLEYGRLPIATSGTTDNTNAPNSDIMTALTRSNELNPRGIVFFEAKNARGNPPRAGLDGGGIYRDPWGNPYTFMLDTSYDNKVTADVGEGNKEYFATVVVMSTNSTNKTQWISNVR